MNTTLQKGLYEVILPVLHQVPEHPDSMERKRKQQTLESNIMFCTTFKNSLNVSYQEQLSFLFHKV